MKEKEISVALCSVKECYDLKRIFYVVIRFAVSLSVATILLLQLCVSLPFMNANLLSSLMSVGGILILLLVVYASIRLTLNIKASKESVLNLYSHCIYLKQRTAFNHKTVLNLEFNQIESVKYIRNLAGLIHNVVITYNENDIQGKTVSFALTCEDALSFVKTYKRLQNN